MASSPGVNVVLSLCKRCDKSCGVSQPFYLAAVARLMLWRSANSTSGADEALISALVRGVVPAWAWTWLTGCSLR